MTNEDGQCQRFGCTNVGKRTQIAFAGFIAERGLPAGERWYCDDCAKHVRELLGDVVSLNPDAKDVGRRKFAKG